VAGREILSREEAGAIAVELITIGFHEVVALDLAAQTVCPCRYILEQQSDSKAIVSILMLLPDHPRK
jgi:hypothetical protein